MEQITSDKQTPAIVSRGDPPWLVSLSRAFRNLSNAVRVLALAILPEHMSRRHNDLHLPERCIRSNAVVPTRLLLRDGCTIIQKVQLGKSGGVFWLGEPAGLLRLGSTFGRVIIDSIPVQ